MLPSGGEFLLIIVAAIMLFGGRELPKIMRTLGKWTAMIKSSLNDVRREFNRISIEEELKERDRVEREKLKKEGLPTGGTDGQSESPKAELKTASEAAPRSEPKQFDSTELEEIREKAKVRAAEIEAAGSPLERKKAGTTKKRTAAKKRTAKTSAKSKPTSKRGQASGKKSGATARKTAKSPVKRTTAKKKAPAGKPVAKKSAKKPAAKKTAKKPTKKPAAKKSSENK